MRWRHASRQRATVALGLIKQALDESGENDLAGQLDLERDLQVEAAETPDHAEGVRAFLEKRAARFHRASRSRKLNGVHGACQPGDFCADRSRTAGKGCDTLSREGVRRERRSARGFLLPQESANGSAVSAHIGRLSSRHALAAP